MKRMIRISIVVLVLLLPVTALPAAERSNRPAAWANPVASEHLRNFHQLDDKLYRSAQPDRKGFRELEKLGIRHVLSFRDHHSDDDEAKGTGVRLHRIKMEAGEIRTAQVAEALRIIRDADGPVLVHCWHGSDRTGLVSAMYRVVFQGWTKEAAIDELVNGGFGYHALYKNIPEYIRQVDIAEVGKMIQEP